MDGMLSQDEINALLSGMDPGDMAGAATPDTGAPADAGVSPDDTLSDVEKDAVGEVANISMGSSATTLYSLVNRKVNITTPVVSMVNWQGVTGDYEKPCVFIQIHYTAGLDGSNILVLREHDVKVITDLMMGGDGTNTDGELGELHLSAISEAMNQMMGAAATSLSTMLGTMIDISPPDATLLDLTEYQNGEDISPFLGGTFVKVAFTMQIEDLVDSTIMQLYPLDFAKRLVKTFMDSTAPAEPEPAPAPAPQAAPTPQQQPQQQPQMQPGMGGMDQSMNGMPNMGMPNMGMGMPGMMMPGMMPNMQQMNVQPAQFQSFNPEYAAMQANENIGLIMDVPLNVTV
ncbi:MAG: flagellar motor switch phosphatase FliY, partial [Lachnospiraceae bacterium]|nr:flagellar motor switch phosphatase FliY [Lachnospiraceae bacterium]